MLRREHSCHSLQVGIYSPGCGLKHVFMSWGASEFLHMVLSLNTSSQLPPIALSLLRLQKFTSLTRPGMSTQPHGSVQPLRKMPDFRLQRE
jgi:hypothetical protein